MIFIRVRHTFGLIRSQTFLKGVCSVLNVKRLQTHSVYSVDVTIKSYIPQVNLITLISIKIKLVVNILKCFELFLKFNVLMKIKTFPKLVEIMRNVNR